MTLPDRAEWDEGRYSRKMAPSFIREPQGREKKGRSPMTLCAAVICKNGDQDALLGVSDRKYISGDVAFETGLLKIYGFSPHRTVALGAGDTEAYYAIAARAHRELLAVRPNRVMDVAYRYAVEHRAERRARAETDYLAPLGYDLNSFKSDQKSMEPSLARRLARKMQTRKLEVQAIIAGIDSDGPHIWLVGRH